MSDIDPYNLSDDDLEKAFLEAKKERDEAANATESEVEQTEDETTETEETSEESEDDSNEEQEESEESEQEQSSEDETEESEEESAEQAESEETEDKPKGKKGKTEKTTESTDSTSVTHKFKANGKDYEFTDDELKAQLPRMFGQAMDYTKKMQEIAPWRKTIDAMKHAKLQHDDVNLMIDVLKGDKAAVAALLKRTGVDPIDINQDEQYERKDYGRDNVALDLEDVLSSIRGDKEYSVTHNIIGSEWDDASWKVLQANPSKIKGLHEDVKSGIYDKLLPHMTKLKVFDGASKSDLDYYLEAARNYFTQAEKEQTQQREQALSEREQALNTKTKVAKVTTEAQKRTTTKEAAVKRKAAAPTGRSTGKGGPVDYLNASEEDFEEWYKKLEER